jgi:hypothetical protein
MVEFYARSSNIELWDFVHRKKHSEIVNLFDKDQVWEYAQEEITDDFNRYIIKAGDIYYVIWYKHKIEKKFESPCFSHEYHYDDLVHYFKVYKFITSNNVENELNSFEMSQRSLMRKISALEYLNKKKGSIE